MPKVMLIGKRLNNSDNNSNADFLQVSKSALVCAETDESDETDDNCNERPVHGYLMSAIDSYNDHMICPPLKATLEQGKPRVNELSAKLSSPLYTPIKLVDCVDEIAAEATDEKGDKRAHRSCSEISESSVIDSKSIPSRPLFTPVKIPLGVCRDRKSKRTDSCESFKDEMEQSRSANCFQSVDIARCWHCMNGGLDVVNQKQRIAQPRKKDVHGDNAKVSAEHVKPVEPAKPVDPVLSLSSHFYSEQPRKQLTKRAYGNSVVEKHAAEKVGNPLYQNIPPHIIEEYCDGNFPSIKPSSSLLHSSTDTGTRLSSQPESAQTASFKQKKLVKKENDLVTIRDAGDDVTRSVELMSSLSCKTLDKHKQTLDRDTLSDSIGLTRKNKKSREHTEVKIEDFLDPTADRAKPVDVPVGCSPSSKKFMTGSSKSKLNDQNVKCEGSFENHTLKLSESSRPFNAFPQTDAAAPKDTTTDPMKKTITLNELAEDPALAKKPDVLLVDVLPTRSPKSVTDPVILTEQLDCADEVEIRLSRSSRPFKTYKLIEKPTQAHELEPSALKNCSGPEIKAPFGQAHFENLRDLGCGKLDERDASEQVTLVTLKDGEFGKHEDEDQSRRPQLVTLKQLDCGCQNETSKNDAAISKDIELDCHSMTVDTRAQHNVPSQHLQTASNFNSKGQPSKHDELNYESSQVTKAHRDVGVNCRMRKKYKTLPPLCPAPTEKTDKLDPLGASASMYPPICPPSIAQLLQQGIPKQAQAQVKSPSKTVKNPCAISPLVTNNRPKYKVADPPFESVSPPNQQPEFQQSLQASIRASGNKQARLGRNNLGSTYNPTAGCSDWGRQKPDSGNITLVSTQNSKPASPFNAPLPAQTDDKCATQQSSLMDATYNPAEDCIQTSRGVATRKPNLIDASYDPAKYDTSTRRGGALRDTSPMRSTYDAEKNYIQANYGGTVHEPNFMDATYDLKEDCTTNKPDQPILKQTARTPSPKYKSRVPLCPPIYTPKKECTTTQLSAFNTTGEPGPGPLLHRNLRSKDYHMVDFSSEKSIPSCSKSIIIPENVCCPPSLVGKGYYIPSSDQIKREWDPNYKRLKVDSFCATNKQSQRSCCSYELSSKAGDQSEFTKCSYTEDSVCEELLSCITDTEMSAHLMRSSSVDPMPKKSHKKCRHKGKECNEGNGIQPYKSKSQNQNISSHGCINQRTQSAPEHNPQRDLQKMHDQLFWAIQDECKGALLRAQAYAELEKMDQKSFNQKLHKCPIYPVSATYDPDIPRHWLRPCL